MKVKLFGIVTDWTEDRADPTSDLSGSVSYCGKSGIYTKHNFSAVLRHIFHHFKSV